MEGEDDYEVISFQLRWAGLSILCFLLSLPLDYILEFLPWRPRRIWLWPLIAPVAILGLSTVGFCAGWIGFRYSDNKGVAKAGMFLNGVVLAIVLALTAAWFYIVASR